MQAHERGEAGAVAKSRYFDTSGQQTWAACTVIQYQAEDDSYLIEWQKTGKRKHAKR